MPKLHTRTAVLMPVHNEDAAAVFARLRAMDASLAETGMSRHFDIFVLSDTRDAQVALAEQACFARFRREAHSNVYWVRKENTGRKAGNIADWVSRWGRRLRAHAGPGRRQPDDRRGHGPSWPTPWSVTPGRGPDPDPCRWAINGQTIFARTLQFATRLYGRVAWTGLA